MADDATSGTTEIVLDLPGFAVLAAAEYGGELEVLVETTAAAAGCPQCGRRASAHGRRNPNALHADVRVVIDQVPVWSSRAASGAFLRTDSIPPRAPLLELYPSLAAMISPLPALSRNRYSSRPPGITRTCQP